MKRDVKKLPSPEKKKRHPASCQTVMYLSGLCVHNITLVSHENTQHMNAIHTHSHRAASLHLNKQFLHRTYCGLFFQGVRLPTRTHTYVRAHTHRPLSAVMFLECQVVKSRSSRLTSDLSAVPRGREDCRRITCVSEISAFRRRKAEINVGRVRVCLCRSRCLQQR